jgi:uncharacterized protein (AIM24 family)
MTLLLKEKEHQNGGQCRVIRKSSRKSTKSLVHNRKKPNPKRGGGEDDEEDGNKPMDVHVDVEGPKIEIKGSTGGQYIVATFTSPSQSILATPGTMIYSKGEVSAVTTQLGGGFMSFMRKAKGAVKRVASGQGFTINTYKGSEQCSPSSPGYVGLSTDIPGDVVGITLQEGEIYRISRGTFITSTHNVTLDADVRVKGAFEFGQEEGLVLPTLKCEKGVGKAWIGGFGTFEKHKLDKGQTMMVDNGVFLAVSNNQPYEMVKTGKSFMGSLFSGEGLAMKFTGPCDVYTQSKNFNNLCREISQNRYFIHMQ